MADIDDQNASLRRRLGWVKIVLVGMAGYLLGSFFPAGYVRYFIQSKIFPETLVAEEPAFDRSILQKAITVTPLELTTTVDTNPSLFRQKFLDRPVRLTGVVKYFLDSSMGKDNFVMTLDTGDEYGATAIIMTFDDANARGIAALRQGGAVTARCVATGITTDSVHLGHCELAR